MLMIARYLIYILAIVAFLSGDAVMAQSWKDRLNYQEPLSTPAPTTGKGCVDFCLSRGGLDKDCQAQCGMYSGDEQLLNNRYMDYYTQPQEGIVFDPESSDINIPSILQRQAPRPSQGFYGVDFKCFKYCRLEGDTYDTCLKLCQP